MDRFRLVASAGVLALALLSGACTPATDGGDAEPSGSGAGSSTQPQTSVQLTAGVLARFDLDGEPHTAELVRVVGASAEVVISSSPSTHLLTEGMPAEADLDDDSVPETVLAVSELQGGRATLTLSSVDELVWDETGFVTTGGLAPYEARSFYESDPTAVVLDDGSMLLFYTSGDRRYVMWERYRADGTQVTSPQLGAGMLDPVPGIGLGEVIDVARVGDAVVIVSQTAAGMVATRYDVELRQVGQPSFLTPWANDAALAGDGERLWLATQEFHAPGDLREGRDAVAIMELASSVPPMRVREARVTEPPVDTDDLAPDLAHDDATGTLAVLYERELGAGRGPYDLRLAVVDPSTLTVLRDVVVARAVEHLDDPTSVAVTAADGVALVFWRTGGAVHHHLARVDLATGSVEVTWERAQEEGIARLHGNNRDLEFVQLADGPALLFHEPNVVAGDAPADRFVLQPLGAAGPVGEAVVLDGGQPVLADVTIDPASLRCNPRKAICGSPCLLTGEITNRGSQPAREVSLDTTVDGEPLGTLRIGTVEEGETITFAKTWEVPPDLTVEEVDVAFVIGTPSEQYTADNDVASLTVPVRQRGLIQGRVTNASGVADPGWWAGGLEGVEVSFGDRSVLTDAGGFFALEEVEFGAGTLTATKDGFNPARMDVETTRTSPIASAGFRMDNHGTLRFTILDAESNDPLAGVQVHVLGYARMDRTDENGEVAYAIPAGSYRLAFTKRGYQSVPPIEFTVSLGEERNETIVMLDATTASLTGQVVDRRGDGVGTASVRILDATGEVAATPAVDADGVFRVEGLLLEPSGSYTIVASGDGVTVEEPVSLVGGEVASVMVELVPGRGELDERVATEGYTSWMLRAANPGFLDVGGQSVYVWYGNYAMQVGAEYWDGSRELNRVSITPWGGKYETHATKGEIEFGVSGDDLTGGAGRKLPPGMADVTDAPSQSWWKTSFRTGYALYQKYDPALNLAKEIYTGVKKVREAWDDEDQWLMLGQGPELLTWKEALEDFNQRPAWDSDHPIDSAGSYLSAIPTSFAIPIVIGGSSVQETAVRVDGIDVVDKETGEVHLTDRDVWYSYQELAADGSAHRSFDLEPGVYTEDVRVFVWITVQKYWHGAPGGTCFSQREKQVVIFDPGAGGMKAFIAPGDLYLEPDRWTTSDIERLTE